MAWNGSTIRRFPDAMATALDRDVDQQGPSRRDAVFSNGPGTLLSAVGFGHSGTNTPAGAGTGLNRSMACNDLGVQRLSNAGACTPVVDTLIGGGIAASARGSGLSVPLAQQRLRRWMWDGILPRPTGKGHSRLPRLIWCCWNAALARFLPPQTPGVTFLDSGIW